MEIKTLEELEDALQYYIIDTEVCLERNYSFNDIIETLKKEIQTVDINIFTNNNLIRDINLIQSITHNYYGN